MNVWTFRPCLPADETIPLLLSTLCPKCCIDMITLAIKTWTARIHLFLLISQNNLSLQIVLLRLQTRTFRFLGIISAKYTLVRNKKCDKITFISCLLEANRPVTFFINKCFLNPSVLFNFFYIYAHISTLCNQFSMIEESTWHDLVAQ